jgi:transposase-like protein
MISCSKCSSTNFTKNGIQNKQQRYKCADCHCTFQVKNPKYSDEFKLRCIEMYLNNVGIRKIAKLQKVSHVLIIYWIKNIAKNVKNMLVKKVDTLTKQDIEILEVDELVTYIKKNLQNTVNTVDNIHLFGLLSIGMRAKLLILK